MKKIVWMYLCLLITSVLILTACGGGNAETSDEDGEKTLTIAQGADMISWDVHDHGNTSTEAIHVNVFNYLVKYIDGEAIPDLATEWEMIDETVWEFTLRDDVTFHNGDDFTAEDVKFSLERVSQDESLYEYPNYRQIESVEIIDDFTIRIHTVGPEPVLLNRLSRLGSGILPKNYIEEHGMDHFMNEPVGTGPYQYVDWIRDDRVILEKYSDYFEGDIAEWDKVEFRSIPETSTRVAEALTGGVDIASNIAPADWDRVDENEGTSIVTGPTNRVMMLFLRQDEGYPTADLRVRQAIDLAIDNQAIIDNVLGGNGEPTKTRINPGTFGVDESLHGVYDYDVEKAKELMAEAGYEDGFEMTLHSPNGRYLMDKESVEVVSGMLSEIGIQVNMDFMEWGAFIELTDAHAQEDAYLLGLSNSLFDAAHSLRYYNSAISEPNIGYKNEKIDELLAAAEVNMDSEEREAQYIEVQQLAAEDLPHIKLFQLDNFFAVSDDIEFSPKINEMIYIWEIKSK